jgi:hypothetical protein
MKTSARIAGVVAGIQIEHLLHTDPQYHCETNLFSFLPYHCAETSSQ